MVYTQKHPVKKIIPLKSIADFNGIKDGIQKDLKTIKEFPR